jgi:hypothetical protein
MYYCFESRRPLNGSISRSQRSGRRNRRRIEHDRGFNPPTRATRPTHPRALIPVTPRRPRLLGPPGEGSLVTSAEVSLLNYATNPFGNFWLAAPRSFAAGGRQRSPTISSIPRPRETLPEASGRSTRPAQSQCRRRRSTRPCRSARRRRRRSTPRILSSRRRGPTRLPPPRARSGSVSLLNPSHPILPNPSRSDLVVARAWPRCFGECREAPCLPMRDLAPREVEAQP